MTETRSQNFTAIHRSSVKFRARICRFKTFCMRIFARKTFLRCSILDETFLDVLAYMLECVFCSHIPLEIEFKRRV